MTKLVLASASLFRRQLLSRLGVPFTVSAQHIDETRFKDEPPQCLVERLARAKAESGLADCQQDDLAGEHVQVVVGSDQVGAIESDVLGKPVDYDAAVEQLRRASGQVVAFFTAVCLLRSDSDESIEFVDTTHVRFRTLGLDEIRSYIVREQPYGSCGSFQVEGLGISLVEEIISTDPTALIGLPLIRLYRALQQWQITD